MTEFLHSQFDKMLLTVLLLIFCAMAFHAFHAGGEAGLAGFASDQAKEFAGALLGLITGHALAQAARHDPPPPGNATK